MKLVEPGPQPPPFEVEYSELESDKPRAEQQPEDDVSPAESTVEAASDTQAPSSPDDGSDGSAAEKQSQPLAQAAAPSVESASENADVADSFGAGLDVGDVASQPTEKEQPTVEKESAATAASETDTAATDSESDSGGKKRGKRPNRRRRSRRGQKKDGGSVPKSES